MKKKFRWMIFFSLTLRFQFQCGQSEIIGTIFFPRLHHRVKRQTLTRWPHYVFFFQFL